MTERRFNSEDLKVLTFEGFVARYRAELSKGVSRKAAYWTVETIYTNIVGRPRFATENAFRQALRRYKKKVGDKCH